MSQRLAHTQRSPFRFVGSKYQAIRFIRPIWEAVDHDEYREPMIGGGAVFFAKPKAEYNWINDLDSGLIKTYSVMQDRQLRPKMIRRLEAEMPTRERHKAVKRDRPSNDMDIACRYYFLNRTSYSGMMNLPPWGYSSTKSVPPSRWGDRIEESGEKLTEVKITCHDFTQIIGAPQRGKTGTFLFVDPPYFLADQKRAYIHSFELEDHYRLNDALKKTRHKFCLTYDDCAEVRELYEWAEMLAVSWRYHVANSNKADRRMGRELIITNFALS